METWLKYVIGIGMLLILGAIFVFTFILYHKLPAPKGCEDILPSEGKCHGCKEVGCHFNLYYNSKEEKKEEEETKHDDVN